MECKFSPGGTSGKEPASQCRRHKRCGFDPWVGKIPWRRAWQPTPVFLPAEFHGQWSSAGYSQWGHKESDTTERLTLWLSEWNVINLYLFKKPHCHVFLIRLLITSQLHQCDPLRSKNLELCLLSMFYFWMSPLKYFRNEVVIPVYTHGWVYHSKFAELGKNV